MPNPPNYARVLVGGVMPGGEVFSFSFAAQSLGPGTSAQAQATNLGNSAQFAAFVNACKPFMSVPTVINRVSVYQYGAGGSLTDSGSAGVIDGAGSGAVPHPDQCALAVSLRTASNTRSGRGRFFIPCNGAAMDANTGRTTANTQTLATAAAALMAFAGGRVASEKLGTTALVTAVRVGNVVDTMRSRRDALVESYSTAAV